MIRHPQEFDHTIAIVVNPVEIDLRGTAIRITPTTPKEFEVRWILLAGATGSARDRSQGRRVPRPLKPSPSHALVAVTVRMMMPRFIVFTSTRIEEAMSIANILVPMHVKETFSQVLDLKETSEHLQRNTLSTLAHRHVGLLRAQQQTRICWVQRRLTTQEKRQIFESVANMNYELKNSLPQQDLRVRGRSQNLGIALAWPHRPAHLLRTSTDRLGCCRGHHLRTMRLIRML